MPGGGNNNPAGKNQYNGRGRGAMPSGGASSVFPGYRPSVGVANTSSNEAMLVSRTGNAGKAAKAHNAAEQAHRKAAKDLEQNLSATTPDKAQRVQYHLAAARAHAASASAYSAPHEITQQRKHAEARTLHGAAAQKASKVPASGLAEYAHRVQSMIHGDEAAYVNGLS